MSEIKYLDKKGLETLVDQIKTKKQDKLPTPTDDKYLHFKDGNLEWTIPYWTGTHDEYAVEEKDIPVGTIVNFTDDYQEGGGGGSDNYDKLKNQPQIEGVTLSGNKSASDLGLATVDGVKDSLTQKQDEIPEYTLARYEEIKDSIPTGTQFIITDDYNNPSYSEITVTIGSTDTVMTKRNGIVSARLGDFALDRDVPYSANSTVINGTIPEGYRPKNVKVFPAIALRYSSTWKYYPCYMYINNNGQIRVANLNVEGTGSDTINLKTGDRLYVNIIYSID